MPKVIEEARVLSHAYPISGVDILTIEAPMIARGALPGQFVQITVPAGGGFLRRPLGIAEVSRDKGWIRLIYRQVGRGTASLAAANTRETVSVLGPLGHGFNTSFRHPLLVGGGWGSHRSYSLRQSIVVRRFSWEGVQKKSSFGRKSIGPMCVHAL